MKTAILVFVFTLFAGIAFSQETMHEKASDSNIRFYGNSEKASDKIRFYTYFMENRFRGDFLMDNRVREENRNNKYFKSYNLGVINQSLLLNNFRLRTRTSRDKC